MKHLKKLASILLVLVMVLSVTTTAFAANVSNETKHSYNAYQIFSGTQADNSVPLGDVAWGSDINGAAFLAELKTDTRFVKEGTNIFTSCTTAADVAAVLGGYTDKSDEANAFANVAAKHLTTTFTAIAADASTVDLAAGYYLLVDTSTPGEGDAMNSALLQVTNQGNITIAKKYGVPTVDKSVKDTDDKWGEAADWEIGSDVPFQLVGTLPTNFADYETYKYVFHDTLSAGLQYNGDVKVYVQNGETKTEITTSCTVDPAAAATAGGGTLTVTFTDLKAVEGVTATSKIVVEYTAKLLSTAEIGNPGNKNEVYLEYSNNPNHTGEGTPTGNTPNDEVLVFTYELDVTKVDGQNTDKKLAKAEFVLLNNDKTKVAKVANGKLVEWVNVPAGENGTITYPAGTTLTSDADGKFVIAGLDAGSYYLRETKAPAGYNLLKNDISVTITATLDKAENNPALTSLKLAVKDDKTDAAATESNGSVGTGIVATNVMNNSGTELPSTGGIGTTLFYVLGGILVLVAIVLLVTRKRMSHKEK